MYLGEIGAAKEHQHPVTGDLQWQRAEATSASAKTLLLSEICDAISTESEIQLITTTAPCMHDPVFLGGRASARFHMKV